jgi:hypothetical protein
MLTRDELSFIMNSSPHMVQLVLFTKALVLTAQEIGVALWLNQ